MPRKKHKHAHKQKKDGVEKGRSLMQYKLISFIRIFEGNYEKNI